MKKAKAMLCPQCGREGVEGEWNCRSCGAPLGQPAKSRDRRKRRLLPIGLAGLALAIAALALRIVACPRAPLASEEPRPGAVRVFEGGEFAWIPAGQFQMGSDLSGQAIVAAYGGEAEWAKALEDELPAHPVTISRGFWMETHEVTNGEFEAFAKAEGYKTDAERAGVGYVFNPDKGWWAETPGVSWMNPGWQTTRGEPVVVVSWNDATAYCQWLSGKTGETYRLPTEAEWEYACRAGSTTQFFWGDRAEEGQGYLNAADAAPRPGGEPWRYRFPFSDGFWRTAPVKSFRPNAWGLYDMAGNACEWCRDWYGEFSSDPATDPKGPRSGEYRVVRGGSWYVCPVSCRSAYRYRYSPAMAGDLNGFRVCRLGSGG